MKKFLLTLALMTMPILGVHAHSSSQPPGIPVLFSLDNVNVDISNDEFTSIPFHFTSVTNASFGTIAQPERTTFTLTPGVYEISFWGQVRNTDEGAVQYQFGIRNIEDNYISWRTRDGTETDVETFTTTTFFGLFDFTETRNIQIVARQLNSTSGPLLILSRGLSIKKLH